MLPEDRLPMRRGEMIVPALAGGLRLLSMAHLEKRGRRQPYALLLPWYYKAVHPSADWAILTFLLLIFLRVQAMCSLPWRRKLGMSGALIVTTPQEIALQDVKRAIDLFEQVRVPILGVVENMSYYIPAPGKDRYHPSVKAEESVLPKLKVFLFWVKSNRQRDQSLRRFRYFNF